MFIFQSGEKRSGFFVKNRDEKNRNNAYPFWREAYMTRREYDYFNSIADLPGCGVIMMEFIKP